MDTIILAFIAILFIVSIWRWKPGKTVYMGTTKEVDFSKDLTTATPIPLHSATCSHTWDTLDDKTLEMPHEKKHLLVLQCHTCGILDKTTVITSPAPPIPPVVPTPCKHNWDAVVNSTLDVEHEKKVVAILTCKLCGKLDKTVEVTSKAPEPVLTKDQCRHKWNVEKKILIDSAYEQMLESIKVKTNNYSNTKKIDPNKALDLELQFAPPWMFRKTLVQIMVCSACGEVSKTIASNMGEESEVTNGV